MPTCMSIVPALGSPLITGVADDHHIIGHRVREVRAAVHCVLRECPEIARLMRTSQPEAGAAYCSDSSRAPGRS